MRGMMKRLAIDTLVDRAAAGLDIEMRMRGGA
jgi:hypothetical protein